MSSLLTDRSRLTVLPYWCLHTITQLHNGLLVLHWLIDNIHTTAWQGSFSWCKSCENFLMFCFLKRKKFVLTSEEWDVFRMKLKSHDQRLCWQGWKHISTVGCRLLEYISKGVVTCFLCPVDLRSVSLLRRRVGAGASHYYYVPPGAGLSDTS